MVTPKTQTKESAAGLFIVDNTHDLGIHSTRGHFVALGKKLLAQQHIDSPQQLELAVAETALQRETLFEHLVVPELSALRRKIEKELTTTHLRALQAPPVLKCWMELN